MVIFRLLSLSATWVGMSRYESDISVKSKEADLNVTCWKNILGVCLDYKTTWDVLSVKKKKKKKKWILDVYLMSFNHIYMHLLSVTSWIEHWDDNRSGMITGKV